MQATQNGNDGEDEGEDGKDEVVGQAGGAAAHFLANKAADG